jgi:hypothetical protein
LSLLVGTQDVTNSAQWHSSDATIATVAAGLVRATGPGTATVSATYQSKTVSTPLTVAADTDCSDFDPSALGMIQITQDVPPSWAITTPFQGGFELLAGADTLSDANRLLALFQRYRQQCDIGRGNVRPNRLQYILSYFKGTSGQQTTVAPEDCIAYNPSALQVVDQGASGAALMSGGTQLALLDNAFEAALAAAVARQYSNECFIGRGNTRPNPYRFITEYWK